MRVNPLAKRLWLTAVRGESWRCQAVSHAGRGRRCTKAASFEADHPLIKTPMRICPLHKLVLDNGAELRYDASRGVDTKRLAVMGGPLDGDFLDVPWDLRVGDTWMVHIQGGDLHAMVCLDAERLQDMGAAEPPPPAAPASQPEPQAG